MHELTTYSRSRVNVIRVFATLAAIPFNHCAGRSTLLARDADDSWSFHRGVTKGIWRCASVCGAWASERSRADSLPSEWAECFRALVRSSERRDMARCCAVWRPHRRRTAIIRTTKTGGKPFGRALQHSSEKKLEPGEDPNPAIFLRG